MNALDHMTAVWRQAAQDLGFEFIAPFTLSDGDQTLSYLGLVPQFGSPKGMLVIVDLQYDDHVRIAAARLRLLLLLRAFRALRPRELYRRAERLGLVWLGRHSALVVYGRVVDIVTRRQ